METKYAWKWGEEGRGGIPSSPIPPPRTHVLFLFLFPLRPCLSRPIPSPPHDLNLSRSLSPTYGIRRKKNFLGHFFRFRVPLPGLPRRGGGERELRKQTRGGERGESLCVGGEAPDFFLPFPESTKLSSFETKNWANPPPHSFILSPTVRIRERKKI